MPPEKIQQLRSQLANITCAYSFIWESGFACTHSDSALLQSILIAPSFSNSKKNITSFMNNILGYRLAILSDLRH